MYEYHLKSISKLQRLATFLFSRSEFERDPNILTLWSLLVLPQAKGTSRGLSYTVTISAADKGPRVLPGVLVDSYSHSL